MQVGRNEMNKLISEQSPYLKAHANDPIDWYPWDEEAFEKARREDKPVFLSIGYSTCHWCHVMAQESFSDEIIGEILNRDYISIKLDREERPDIDSVYMSVCTALTGSAGWPLTIIMTPEQKPFFAGTYIPRDSINGNPGLAVLLTAIASKWQTERRELLTTANEVSAFISASKPVKLSSMGENNLKSAVEQFKASFDGEYGGFGTAPKFPSAHNLLFLLRYAHFSGDRDAKKMVDLTLQQMYRGGIFDHIGGGFSRYSTDREWLVPHFEKTLYDNALLALVYTEAWEDGHYGLYRDVAEATLDYCLRELRDENGGFYCAQDADSDGIEGGYYIFIPEEIRKVLGENEGRHFCECYDITSDGNFGTTSIPNLIINQRWNLLPEGYEEYRSKLREYRSKRLELKTDRKQLLSWNALMLSALSKAYCAFGKKRYLEAATELKAFLDSLDENALCVDGVKKGIPTLDALSFHAVSLLDWYNTSYDSSALTKSAALAEKIIKEYSDGKGSFYDTAVRAETLISRPRTVFDGAMPSGNSAAAVLFDRLFRLSGEIKWKKHRDELLRVIAGHSESYPAGCAYALIAAMSSVYTSRELVCTVADSIPTALYTVTDKYAPELSVLVRFEKDKSALDSFAPFTADMKLLDGKSAFYVCADGACFPPLAVE